MKYVLGLVALVALVILGTMPLSGCGGTAAAEDPSKIKVGIVFDIGGKDDRSFNAAAGQEAARRIQAAYHVDDEPSPDALKLVKEIINE